MPPRSPAPTTRSMAAGPRSRAAQAPSDGVQRRGNALLINSAHGPSRCVSNVQDINCIFAHAIKDPKWIANHGDDADLGALRNSRSSIWDTANAIDDVFQPSSDGVGNHGTGACGVIGCDIVQISKGSSRIDELHAERNFAKTALISASVADSPASMEAIAESMILNSS